jgi:hypothetical protein
MATATYKILGQAQLATSATTIYSCGTANTGGAVVSTLLLANTAGSALTYTLHTSAGGTVTAGSTCFASAVSIAANDTVALTIGICLAASSVLSGQASVANQVTAMAFGSEIVN